MNLTDFINAIVNAGEQQAALEYFLREATSEDCNELIDICSLQLPLFEEGSMLNDDTLI